jgi:multisubunit Na+/H+ antiporter MnhB subunit
MLDERLKDISEIRSLMEQSTKFMSLSGLSGISAGIVGLIGAFATYQYLAGIEIYATLTKTGKINVSNEQLLTLVGIAMVILSVAVGLASFFSIRMARKKKLPIWNSTSKRLLMSIFVPLMVGAIFCLQLAIYEAGGLIPAATLLFYGLALLNASKYTISEIHYLAISQLLLGLIGSFFPEMGLFFWGMGFGVMHIVYGTIMYWKYER